MVNHSVVIFGHFRWHGLAPLVSLEGRVTANKYKVLLTDHVCPVMKHFYPDGCSFHTHRAH